MELSQNVDQAARRIEFLKNATDLTCKACGGKYFREAVSFKHVSAIMSQTGRDEILPLPVYRCDDCGEIPEIFKPKV